MQATGQRARVKVFSLLKIDNGCRRRFKSTEAKSPNRASPDWPRPARRPVTGGTSATTALRCVCTGVTAAREGQRNQKVEKSSRI